MLALFEQSKYSPKVRSPLNINLIRDVVVGSFVLEVKMLSTTKDYDHRDMCLFFGHQGPSHFYYVHIANKSDAHANSIFVVDSEPRVSIAKTRTAGTKWDDKWHTVRLVRDAEKGTIEVFFDDGAEPIMTAVDKRFAWGRVGIGSFDDTGRYDSPEAVQGGRMCDAFCAPDGLPPVQQLPLAGSLCPNCLSAPACIKSRLALSMTAGQPCLSIGGKGIVCARLTPQTHKHQTTPRNHHIVPALPVYEISGLIIQFCVVFRVFLSGAADGPVRGGGLLFP